MSVKDKLEDSMEHIEAYVQTRFELVLLNTSDKIAHLITDIVLLFIVGIVSLCIALFVGIGLAWWIGDRLQNMPAGFFIVSGIYILLGIILYIVSKKTIKTTFVKQLLNLWNHDRKH
ncbi:phage holin family protein [Xanthocytophaga flavus]|nr:phage holin family protein [Xanthocytophaga flavus]